MAPKVRSPPPAADERCRGRREDPRVGHADREPPQRPHLVAGGRRCGARLLRLRFIIRFCRPNPRERGFARPGRGDECEVRSREASGARGGAIAPRQGSERRKPRPRRVEEAVAVRDAVPARRGVECCARRARSGTRRAGTWGATGWRRRCGHPASGRRAVPRPSRGPAGRTRRSGTTAAGSSGRSAWRCRRCGARLLRLGFMSRFCRPNPRERGFARQCRGDECGVASGEVAVGERRSSHAIELSGRLREWNPRPQRNALPVARHGRCRRCVMGALTSPS